ncbi:MAG: hypothetical protein IKW54_06150 [Bacteroidales bacterium]|nr:hypothetical protein [Bacteroidales bacterium]MBR5216519.1 hypothetical protein [Bacteroidales bacterium]
MEKKDNFIIGFIGAAVIFIVLYSIINLFTGFTYFSRSSDSLWVYMLPLIVDLVLARFMLVKWNMENTGRGMMFVTLVGIVSVMFFVLK